MVGPATVAAANDSHSRHPTSVPKRKSSTPPTSPKASMISSLGTGGMGGDGRISFVASPKKKNGRGSHWTGTGSSTTTTRKQTETETTRDSAPAAKGGTDAGACGTVCNSSAPSTTTRHRSAILRVSCSFLRVADLEMDHQTWVTTSSSLGSSLQDNGNEAVQNEPNIHHAAVNPPPGVDVDPRERWIALTTDTDGSHAPIAPIAMDRLANFGLTTSLNEPMWVADPKTDRLLKRPGTQQHPSVPGWMKATFKPGKIHMDSSHNGRSGSCPYDSEVLVWSGCFKHGLYGSDLPAIRAAGIVNMSAKALMELLVDSTRVREYNKLSLGRQDLVTFDGDLHTPGPFGTSITKVMRSETRPPVIRKSLVFVSILHAKELVDGSGYLIVTRAVHQQEEEKSMASAIKSEIIMGVNLIRKIECDGDDGVGDQCVNKCVLINVNHIRSPLVPMMVAKRIGVSSAVGFINDIRSLC